jgi:hypothetical protein
MRTLFSLLLLKVSSSALIANSFLPWGLFPIYPFMLLATLLHLLPVHLAFLFRPFNHKGALLERKLPYQSLSVNLIFLIFGKEAA